MNEPTGTQYGGFWIRFVALLADSAILYVLAVVILGGAAVALGPELLPPLIIAVWVLSFLYFPVMHASGLQATFGKAIVGLKVARLHGGRISILRSLGRELAKILSGAVLLVGYIMAAFTPRKQGLHDLVAATYVMRQGPARVIPAVAVIVAGFVLPFVVVPIVLGEAAMAMVASAAQSMADEYDPVKQAAPAPKPAPKAAPKPPAPVQVAKAPAAAPAPAPVPEQKAPTPAAPAPAATPAPQTTPAPQPTPAPQAAAAKAQAKAEAPKVEAPKPAPPLAEVKPAAKPAPKPKPGPTRIVEAPRKPAAVPAAAPKVASAPKPGPVVPKEISGPKFNDLMTAVLYRDAEGITELLKLGKWPDKRDSRGATPLMMAVELGDPHTAEALLRGGANPRFAMPVAEERGNGEMILLLKRYSAR